jgi:hypothetical protein
MENKMNGVRNRSMKDKKEKILVKKNENEEKE